MTRSFGYISGHTVHLCIDTQNLMPKADIGREVFSLINQRKREINQDRNAA